MSPKNPAYNPNPDVADLQPLVEDEKPAAYAGCPVEHAVPMVLSGPGCATVLIEDKMSDPQCARSDGRFPPPP